MCASTNFSKGDKDRPRIRRITADRTGFNNPRKSAASAKSAVYSITAKTLLASSKTPDPWFGIKYTMNLFRGCQHHCIYCDSRSQCYGIADFDGEVLVKENALDLLRRELRSKRVKGYVGTGSMNDPYMPVERRLRLTRQALAILAEARFPVHVLTKSDLVLRDLDLLTAIDAATRTSTPGAVVSITITTADDALARRLEPSAPPPSARFAALARLAAAGLCTGVLLMPVLPFLEDDPANIRAIVERAADAGAHHVIPAWGVTLRDRQRDYFYAQLDQRFPGVRARYERAFGERYSATSPRAAELETLFGELAARFNLARTVAPYRAEKAEQLALL